MALVQFAERKAIGMAHEQWWTFDRPVRRDPLFLAAIVVGVLSSAWAVVTADEPSAFLLAYLLVGGFVSGWFPTGVVAGSVRSFVRAYRGDR